MSQEATHIPSQPKPMLAAKVPAHHGQSEAIHRYNSPGLTDSIKRLTPLSLPLIQPKLKIGAPNDKYEQEADRVAEQVMRMPEPHAAPAQTSPPQIQRLCPECEEELHRLPEQVSEEQIQTKMGGSQAIEAGTDTAAQLQSLGTGGRPLPESVRQYFEPRFSKDFSAVRIHHGSKAAHLAGGINARAFTLGNSIVFNHNQYQPHSQSGRHLLAHELTHVVQQTGSSRLADGKLIQRMTDASYEADGLGTAISNGDMVADNTIMGHTFTARNCRGLHGCNIDFEFGKAYKGVYNYAAAGRDVRGVYVKISSSFNAPVCGECNTVRLIQTVQNITQGSAGMEAADPGNATRRERSGWGDTNAPSRGWRIDRLVSATNPFYTAGASGNTGTSTTPAILWDAPGDWTTDSNMGKEFQTCAVCDHGGARRVMGCVDWGYHTDSAQQINFRPATPSASCGPTRELEDAAARWDAISGNQSTNIDFSSEQRIHSGNRSMLFFEQNSTNFLRGDVMIDSDARKDSAIRWVRQDLAALGNSAFFVIHGYASEEGAPTYNMDLSRRRAQAVKDMFVAAGLPADRFSIMAHGEDTTYPGLTYNRRVEVEHTIYVSP